MTSNVNFSGTRKAMDALESALESLDIILCDKNIFTATECSLVDPQMKICYTSILVKLLRNLRQKTKYYEITTVFFFWKRFRIIFFGKKISMVPKMVPWIDIFTLKSHNLIFENWKFSKIQEFVKSYPSGNFFF